ncbi:MULTISPECIES: dihydroxyacetone kinase subunit DhaL [Amycolatopsis]|uniref:Dihydroxyacetone kinase subunit L n=1 Tax=Amycolatopsis thermalba TaxID=944492 RepID=A0ABY4P5J1_9PSEU|nr:MULTISPECIES: dihydroxyacetone kinase subunit DhaL [Amycolatopsis]OXM72224.1 dihydroxyacetone kinase subunit L [Amycolatopsis sp. KNN50.9b]UQS27589.1 dihydroxyacetone kinase subunit L [Amycolatopsis thermalba]
MTTLGTAETFKRDWLDGFVTAYGREVRKVPDAYGVLGRNVPRQGKVAVIIGGGCGHYPAFAGLVGPGLADAAVVGDVFTSPSAEQVYRTARAAEGGAGVLFAYGNYAGDVLHFGLAARRLAAEGIESRTILITDDIASGPADAPEKRRGVAGDFIVFKVAGAAAERGDDLDAVYAAAVKANANTRTFGVAFGGCTLPGADQPLFTVGESEMELGLGIHGEPGVRTVGRLGAAELADELVDGLLPELPRGDGRVAVLVNGLGRTKYEEMFVTYTRIHERLTAAGLTPVHTEVGEFVTSLDMAGVSLSVLVLDDELAELYGAPCDTPGYRSGGAILEPVELSSTVDKQLDRPEGAGVEVVDRLLTAAMRSIEENEPELGRLDAVAADGDHGLGMTRGMRAAVSAARAAAGSSVADTLLAAGTALADAAGGASGALYGVLLAETGAGLRVDEITTAVVADAVDGAVRAFTELGKAELGEKTMLDAIEPFRQALRKQAEAGAALPDAWRKAAQAATLAAEETANLVPAKGRAARLAQRSKGHADPGATSFALIVTAIGEALSKEGN